MQRSVVVFDTDDERASLTKRTLEQGFAAQSWRVYATQSLPVLKRMLLQREAEVLVVDARSCPEGRDPIDVTCEMVDKTSGVQVVYVGVDENKLARVSSARHASLLPTSFDRNALASAVLQALTTYDRWLEQPLLVRTRNFDRMVMPSRVVFVESDRRKVRIHVSDDVFEAYGKISEFLRMLPSNFVQCHKSFLVNLGFVEQLERDCVVLTTGERVPVSQKRRKETREAFVTYVGRSM